MKLIVAYIRPEALSDVKQALLLVDITKMSVTNVLGCGAQKGYHERYRGADVEIDLLKKVRVEIAVNEPYLDPAVTAIIEAARTPDGGDLGDGKIFIMPLDECIRIRTGERGNAAIG